VKDFINIPILLTGNHTFFRNKCQRLRIELVVLFVSKTRSIPAMKSLLLIVALSALLFSCKEVTFKEPQPAGVPALKEVPSILRGHYLALDQVTGERSDTLIIENWGYHFSDKNDKDWLGRGVISDTLIVKSYENYYFINFKVNDQWALRLIRRKPSGAIEFLSIDIQDDEKRKSILKSISKKMKVTEIQKESDTYYQINPSPAQLMALIKEGFFTGPELQKIISSK
jgi:hypothetical protein